MKKILALAAIVAAIAFQGCAKKDAATDAKDAAKDAPKAAQEAAPAAKK